MQTGGLLHCDAETVHTALPWKELVAALRNAHANREKPTSNASIFDAPAKTGEQFINLTAWSQGHSIVTKLVGMFPRNPALPAPEPSVQGLVALFDGNTGRPTMTCDGAALTYRKTAADSALGSDLLSNREAEVLVLAGAGGLAPYVVEAHCSVRPIRKVIIWNRTRSRADAVAHRLRHTGLDVQVTEDLVQALPEADIISAVTMATEPVIIGNALKPGVHVDLIGAYQPQMREADSETVRRAGKIFVDHIEGFAWSGDGLGPVADGILHGPEADLFDLCSGRHPGRQSRAEVTVFKNCGGGHLDLFTIEALHRKLIEG